MIILTKTGYQVRNNNGKRLSFPILTLEQAQAREKVLISLKRKLKDKMPYDL